MRALFVPSGPSPQGWIHTADVRAKMAVSVLASIMTIAISSFTGQAVLALASFCYALTLRRTGVLLAVYALVIAMTLLAFGCLPVMGLLAPRLLDAFEPAALLVPFLRILVMAHVLLPLALSSRLQTMLNTLHGLHLPFCVYLPAAVALRVLPTFWHDIRQVSESLRLRGYRVTAWNLTRHPLLSLRLLFTPLLFRSLRSSEDLAIAAELKGLGGGGRMTPYRSPCWKRSDTLLVVAALLASALALTCQIGFGGGRSFMV